MEELLIALAVISVVFVIVWIAFLMRTWHAPGKGEDENPNLPVQIGIGFFTNFLDTLGIGSFATTSSIYKLLNAVPDDLIPGTMNVGHTLPSVVQAFILVAVIPVDFRTMVSMITAASAGAWFGAGTVSGWPKRKIQIGLGLALFAAALLMLSSQLKLVPVGGDALGLEGLKFWFAVAASFVFGAIQQLGVGLFAPCMILVSLLGMNPRSAFPIMMGSCAFLMPIGSYRFIKSRRYSPRAAVGLTLGGIPGVIIAAYLVKSLPLGTVRWLVVVVVLYTSAMLLRSAAAEKAANVANGVRR
ncbi:MAG: hypothetical protein ABSA54_12585 [Terriglobales bacterium]|jgi:uncharacterized membrane protein YfcA